MSLLEVRNVSKSFGGLIAPRNLNFDLGEGEILGLIGPNGSGKTTRFNLITGFLRPDKGEIEFEGVKITGAKPHHICQIGIARTFQLVKPCSEMSVLDNVTVGRLYGGSQVRSMIQARSEAGEILGFIRLEGKHHLIANKLNLADRKKLELARALAASPKLLLLDEMMAG